MLCYDFLFSNDAKVVKTNVIHLEKLLRAALRNTFINFEGKVYKQIYRFAMGFPLGPTLPNAFLCFLGQIWIN